MADAGLFIGWTVPVRGREQKSLTVFDKALELFGRLQQQGEIEGFEVVFLEPHGGDLGGFVLLRGDGDRLAQVRVSDEMQRLVARADLTVDGFGVVGAVVGDGIQPQFELYRAQLDELT
jgi:hypothetical protein